MLSVNGVTKQFGRFTALRDVTLEFENGVYGLLAPNGAGKTTLIKMIATLLFPTKGEILWNGENIVDLDASYREILGYLPQDFGYYKSYTPRQYLSYLSALKGLTAAEAKKKIGELLSLVGLSDAADKKMRKFSGGMIRRVGIAQALLGDPKLLILDEPTSGLDPKERVRFRNIIHSLSKDRIILLSTHIVSDIETIANRVVMLRDHTVYCCAAPNEIRGLLKGKVFEASAEEYRLRPEDYLIAQRQEGEKTLLRFACETSPEGAVCAAPNMEDVFLYVYRDEGLGE